jgi:glutamate carboxypeptidase
VELHLEAVSAYKEQPMVSTPESLQLIAIAQEIGEHLGISIDHELRGGGSDASYASRYGLPVLDGLGPIGGCDHSPDEYLRLDSVAPRAALLAGLIMHIGSGKHQFI